MDLLVNTSMDSKYILYLCIITRNHLSAVNTTFLLTIMLLLAIFSPQSTLTSTSWIS